MMLTVGHIDSGTVKTLFKTTTRVQYVEPGYLLFDRDRTLVAQKFVARSLALEGEPVPLGEGPQLRRCRAGLVLGPLAREAEQPASVVLNWTSALPR